jgi:hypothetical protein
LVEATKQGGRKGGTALIGASGASRADQNNVVNNSPRAEMSTRFSFLQHGFHFFEFNCIFFSFFECWVLQLVLVADFLARSDPTFD